MRSTPPAPCTARLLLTLGILAAATSRGSSTQDEAAGPLATYETGVVNGGFNALLTTELALEDGCLVVDAGEATPYVPIFPAGEATWSGEVLTYAGTDYGVSAAISLPGGEGDAPRASRVPTGCERDAYWIVSPSH